MGKKNAAKHQAFIEAEEKINNLLTLHNKEQKDSFSWVFERLNSYHRSGFKVQEEEIEDFKRLLSILNQNF